MTQQPTPFDPTGQPPDETGTPSLMGVPPGNRTPLFEANSAARYQRQTSIKQIQAHTGRRLICYVSGSECMISENDTMPFVDLLHHVQPGERVELLLHTTGAASTPPKS